MFSFSPNLTTLCHFSWESPSVSFFIQIILALLVFSRMEASCLELALEGERLCKAGDFKGGTAFFEAAVQVGTEDLKTLSAIYSQLGNGYFYLKEYGKALEYHRHDLTLARWGLTTHCRRLIAVKLPFQMWVQFHANLCIKKTNWVAFESRTIGDRIGEGKASGNLGNTLKVLGRYDEAAVCCQRHLDISQEQGDKVRKTPLLHLTRDWGSDFQVCEQFSSDG